MLALSHVAFAYPGVKPILDDVSIAFQPGALTTVMGPNGSGKTTLAYLLKGILAPTRGTVAMDGSGAGNRKELMEKVGLVFQNPENTMVATTVETELAFGLENLGVPGPEMRERVADALRKFNLDKYRHTSPERLSGGEKQQLALASVMIMRPECLVLDEPTALLDIPSRWVVTSLLRTLAAEGTTVILITQFADEAEAADRLIVFDSGGVAGDGRPGDILPGFAFHRLPSRCENRNANGQESLLAFGRAGYTYDAGTPFAHAALADVVLDIYKGTATAVLGPSGSGKTTLLELAAGLAMPTAGSLSVEGAPVRAMAFQLPEDHMAGHEVGDYISFGPRNRGITGEALDRVADEALCSVGLDPAVYRYRDPETLSGGEQRLAALAGVLAMDPDLLVLDEPTAGLDPAGRERVSGILYAYMEKGGTLLFSTHDLELALSLAEFGVVLDGGRVETGGTLAEVMERSVWIRSLRNLPQSAYGKGGGIESSAHSSQSCS